MLLKLTSFNSPINLATSVFLINYIQPVLLLQFATSDDTIEIKIDMHFPNGEIYFNYCYPSTLRAIRMNFAATSRLFSDPT